MAMLNNQRVTSKNGGLQIIIHGIGTRTKRMELM